MNMYGNIDVALQFFEKYWEILVENFAFLQCQTDPCIFYKRDEKGRLCMLISTHVDDSLIGGRRWMVEKFYVEFAEHLKIEILGKLKKHLGIWWEWKTDPHNGEVYLEATMPRMVNEIKTAYINATGKSPRAASTPGYPGKCLVRATDEEEEVKTTEYWSIVGKLMYYMTKIGPELANAVRELAGQMVKPNKEHWKALE